MCFILNRWITIFYASDFIGRTLPTLNNKCKTILGLWLPFYNDEQSFVQFQNMSTIFSIFFGWFITKMSCKKWFYPRIKKWSMSLIVHKSNDFLSLMKFEFLFICVISIFINYISKLQRTNVIIWRPLTCKFTKRIKKSSTSCIQEQLEVGALEVKLYLSIGTLHELLCT